MNRNYYRKLLNDEVYNSKLVVEESSLLVDLNDRDYKLYKYLQNLDLKSGIKWTIGYSNYINKLREPNKLKDYQNRTFFRGQILKVDFFGHFGNELTYDHFAVVIHSEKNGLIIAPLTSNPALYEKKKPQMIKLPKCKKDMGSLPKNSTIKLNQMRYISRTRILEVKKRITNRGKLEEIEFQIANMLSEAILLKHEQEKVQYEERIRELEKKIALLEQEKF